jgi:hypothetical protein
MERSLRTLRAESSNILTLNETERVANYYEQGRAQVFQGLITEDDEAGRSYRGSRFAKIPVAATDQSIKGLGKIPRARTPMREM